jgi:uncharacterized protein YjiS (DUF1127 family)
METMTALVTADFKSSASTSRHAASSAAAVEPAGPSLLSRMLAAWRQARAADRLRADLAGMNDALLRDIGIADDEIFLVRQEARFTPRAWTARKPVTRHRAG